jgi:hypothetical protein
MPTAAANPDGTYSHPIATASPAPNSPATPMIGAPQDEFFFHFGRISEEALAQLKRALRGASRECAEIIERDRSTAQKRSGAAFVLAVRPWNYSEFSQFDRDSPAAS